MAQTEASIKINGETLNLVKGMGVINFEGRLIFFTPTKLTTTQRYNPISKSLSGTTLSSDENLELEGMVINIERESSTPAQQVSAPNIERENKVQLITSPSLTDLRDW